MAGEPKDALDQAREAFRSGRYPEALKQYEYFFDHALDNDDHSYYGVRLSYCLDEWAKLGEKYSAALERLEKKRDEALALFSQTRDPERFHDFESICKYLKCENFLLRQFLIYHESDTELAKSAFRFMRDELAAAEQWSVCATYITNPFDDYKGYLEGLDAMLTVHKEEGWDNDLPEKWYVRKVADLFLILKNTGKLNEVASLRNSISADMQSRGLPELAKQVIQRSGMNDDK